MRSHLTNELEYFYKYPFFGLKILWVKDEHQGRGVGTHILKYVEKIAIEKGAIVSETHGRG